MNTTKFFVLTFCIALLVSTQLFCQNETKKWDISLSNAVLSKRIDNVQLEVNRKVIRTWLGLYFQTANYILGEVPYKKEEADYLGRYGFMPQGISWQFGGQIAWHLLHPERKYDLWIKWRAGVNRSYRYNNPGSYWYYKGKQKEYYTITEKQYNKFGNMEMTLGIGLSRKISDNFSVFVEPALNFQCFAQDYRANEPTLYIDPFFVVRYGVSLAF